MLYLGSAVGSLPSPTSLLPRVYSFLFPKMFISDRLRKNGVFIYRDKMIFKLICINFESKILVFVVPFSFQEKLKSYESKASPAWF